MLSGTWIKLKSLTQADQDFLSPSLTGKIYSTSHKQDAAALFCWRSWNPERFSADNTKPVMQRNPAFSRHIMKKVNLFTHHFILWPALLNQLGHWFLHQPLQGFSCIIAALMKLYEKRQNKFTLMIVVLEIYKSDLCHFCYVVSYTTTYCLNM